MDLLSHVIGSPPDPIFSVNLAFAEDNRSEKINAGVGTYRDASLAPYLFRSVKEAERILWAEEKHKDYLPIAGEASYLQATQELVFGKGKYERVCGVQTVGGTGALRLIAELIRHAGAKSILVPEPTWGNHRGIFVAAGLQVHSFDYFSHHTVNYEALHAALHALSPGSVVVLHASCHNPTGCDPTQEQWQQVLGIVRLRKLFVIFDLAYQGFGEGLEEDAYAPRLFVEGGISCAVTVSHSKTFGLYAERVGALYMACRDAAEAQVVLSRLKNSVRSIYSNPPCHGGRIVVKILGTPALRKVWEQELKEIRQRIQEMRALFVKELVEHFGCKEARFAYLRAQKGMFGFVPLAEKEVERLQKEHAIYLTRDGRINLAGLNAATLTKLVRSLER